MLVVLLLQWRRDMMMVQQEEAVGVSVHDWDIGTKRTTIHSFRALLSIGLVLRVTTRRVTSHVTRGSRFARCHSTSCGTFGWLGLYPIA